MPTDFSTFAENAFKVAIQFAEIFKARVHLLHCAVDNSQAEQLDSWRKNYPKVDIETSMQTGNIIDAIVKYTTEKGIDFVVMGSHGISGKSEYFIGSNTQKVVRMVHCPVFVVKTRIDSLRFDKVVFASNFSNSVEPAFLHFKSIIKHFLPEVHLVNIHTSSLFDPPLIVSTTSMDHFKELCAPLKCATHVYRDFTIEQGIRKFSEEIGADLIVVANVEKHPLRRMLTGSKVEALINHADVPVLSIDLPESSS